MGVFVDSRLRIREKTLSLPCNLQPGRLAEWLGRGLQNLVQQFESATDLTERVFNALILGELKTLFSFLWCRVLVGLFCRSRTLFRRK